MISYLLIALMVAAIISISSYFFAINSLYKKEYKKNISFRNTFILEAAPHNKSKESFVNILLYIPLLCLIASAALFMSKYYLFSEVTLIGLLSTTVIFSFCVAMLPHIDLKYLKEHLYLNLGSIILYALASSFVLYLSYYFCKLYDFVNITLIISFAISILLFLVSLIFIFNRRLFDLSNETDENGEPIRAKFIPLAASEWIITISSILLIIPLILMSAAVQIA